MIEIAIKKRKPVPGIAFDTYWKFAAERQAIFFKRLEFHSPPWTDDFILNHFKFTNVYRVTDRVSQYLISNVIYQGDQEPAEILFRILIFKLFNKIETWELLTKKVGCVSQKEFQYDIYNGILETAKNNGQSIYSGAYIMASAKESFGKPLKHQNHLKLIERMISDRLYVKIQLLEKMSELYEALIAYPSIGPFLAYQLATDINYSSLTGFSEMDFVKAGPGAKDGIRKCFTDMGDYSEEDIIRMMTERQEKEFERLGIKFKSLYGRPLQLIDCQNIFCEVDKYSRVRHPEISGISNRKRIKQVFKPIVNSPIVYYFPPKWGLSPI